MSGIKLLSLPKIVDKRGNLSFIENLEHIPFEIQRVYWIYDVPSGEKRGGHAFIKQQEYIVALSGSFDVVTDDGENSTTTSLNRSYNGIYIPNGIWRELNNFSTNSVALILSSTQYNLNDYIRDYNEFLIFKSDVQK
ncbi:MAG: hypothetical protein C0596_04815 [Marinilabiliales bacterium]|nr:MAG: hypothetical protein C0596_04815 [Marinilabiliales bacterium]